MDSKETKKDTIKADVKSKKGTSWEKHKSNPIDILGISTTTKQLVQIGEVIDLTKTEEIVTDETALPSPTKSFASLDAAVQSKPNAVTPPTEPTKDPIGSLICHNGNPIPQEKVSGNNIQHSILFKFIKYI